MTHPGRYATPSAGARSWRRSGGRVRPRSIRPSGARWERPRSRPRSAPAARGLPRLQRPQQVGLEIEGKLADLVDEERAAVGLLEQALAPGGGAGERALGVAEELRLVEVGAAPTDEGAAVAKEGAAPCGLVGGELTAIVSSVLVGVELRRPRCPSSSRRGGEGPCRREDMEGVPSSSAPHAEASGSDGPSDPRGKSSRALSRAQDKVGRPELVDAPNLPGDDPCRGPLERGLRPPLRHRAARSASPTSRDVSTISPSSGCAGTATSTSAPRRTAATSLSRARPSTPSRASRSRVAPSSACARGLGACRCARVARRRDRTAGGSAARDRGGAGSRAYAEPAGARRPDDDQRRALGAAAGWRAPRLVEAHRLGRARDRRGWSR